jgi:hypothetical protein
MEMGTEILLARMKEYPEEFINQENKALGYEGLRWDRVLRDAREHLPKEDVDALDAGLKRLYIDRFNEKVLKTLAGEAVYESEDTLTYKTQGRYTMGMTNALADAHLEHKKHIMEQQRQMNIAQNIAQNSAQNTLWQGLRNGANGTFGSLFGGNK